MANIFLDTNKLISFIGERGDNRDIDISQDVVYISALSIHIIAYTLKYRMPETKLNELVKRALVVALTENIVQLALQGPTADFEDNIQLHSAAEAECDYFLTEDKKLLDMKFFGKSRIVSDLKHSS